MIQSVDRAIRILLALQDEGVLGVSELASRLGLAKGTVHGLLQTLAAHSLVEQDSTSGKYMLGPALLVMGNVYLNSHDLRVRSLRWVASLSESTGLAVRLGVLVWPDVVIFHHVGPKDASVPVSEVGLSMPAHATALGKALLAFHPERRRILSEEPLARLTGQTVTDPDRLNEELDEVRASGVAFEDQEAVVGEASVAGAIFDRSGQAVGAVALVVPADDRGVDPSHIAAIRDTARGISRELGAVTWPG